MKMLDFARRVRSDLGFLVQKEFKQFFRNSFLPKMLVGFPIAAILVIPWVSKYGDKKYQSLNSRF